MFGTSSRKSDVLEGKRDEECSIGKVVTVGLPSVTPAKAVSGRDIISHFIKGDPVALVTYRKICNALEVLEKWENVAKIQFLEQFLDMSDILDNRCTQLVTNLTILPWHAIPAEILSRYQSMLCDIAVRQVCHTELVYKSAVNNLVPFMKINEETKKNERIFSFDEQDKYYTMAHRIISHVLRCFPMSNKTLLGTLQRNFPHSSHDIHRFIDYIRNIIQVTEYACKIRQDIWALIIDQMVICDSMISKTEQDDDARSNSSSGIFVMDEEETATDFDETNQERIDKLDGAMRDVLSYLSLKHEKTIEGGTDVNWLRLGDETSYETLFQMFITLLESHMLMSVHVRYTSFIWLYLCGLKEDYSSRLCDFLWSVIVRPQRAQADVVKAHGAAAYLSAFLARAKYIKIKDTFLWLTRIVQWCVQYVDQCGMSSTQVVPGVTRHGTFYALCQAVFIAFSFRYKELIKSGDIDEVRRWGLGRVIHSPLDPLKYINRPVGLCFAAISRSLQLVYCNHVLPLNQSINRPFEVMFPFDSYKLKSSEGFVVPMMRRFSPLAEDISMLSSALNWEKEPETDESAMDFLDEEELTLGSFRDRGSTITQCGAQNSMFTVYSSSPGLRHFETPMNMR